MAEKKLNYKKTILMGFAFMASTLAWTVYDPYITKILNKLLSESAVITNLSTKLNEAVPFLAKLSEANGDDVTTATGITLVPLFIGIIMTFDNIFGVIFQPTFGRISDTCHSRLGKRRPFIVIGAPISAVLFALIPVMAFRVGSLPLTMTFIILFVFVMSLWRAPCVALMPDLTPPELRSEGNAVINLMSGFGGLIASVMGTIVTAAYVALTHNSKEYVNDNEYVIFPAVFVTTAVLMVLCTLVVLFFVKEPDSRLKAVADARSAAMSAAEQKRIAKEEKAAEKAARKAIKLSAGEKKSLIFMLLSLFFLFCASNAITTYFSLFAAEILHINTSKATLLMVIFAAFSAIAAIPAGKMGKKLGRKKTIIIGLSVFMAAFIVFFAVFTVLIGADGLSIGKYVKVNNEYNTVCEYIDEVNSENGFTDEAYLTYDGFASHMAGNVEDDNYMLVEQKLEEDGYKYENLMAISSGYLGKDAADIGEALTNMSEAVGAVTKVLSILIYPVLVLGGSANMFITVNTLPLVLEIGGLEKVGTFTGYYYTATFSAQIASPIVYGIVRMFSGTYMSLFYYSPVAFLLSFFFILLVKHGEAIPDEIIKQAEEADD